MMRELPTDEQGKLLTPPILAPNLYMKRSGSKTIELLRQIRKYELITPLFGGGVETATTDPVTVIRGASVRGQLRFWWRACRGGQFNGDLEQMKQAENSLWGAADTGPSQVQVVVENDKNPGRPFVLLPGNRGEIHVSDPRSPYGYVAFPLRDKPDLAVQESIKFTLRIVFPRDDKCKQEVEASIWAWETFGGIGARTRRGFGALLLTGLSINGKNEPLSNISDILQFVQQGLATHVVNGQWPSGVPHLSRDVDNYKVTEKKIDSLEAWKSLIKQLKDFRQSRYGSFGRSKWPEPDAIRRLTNRYSNRHTKALSTVDKFPRASFGLPIIFHFKESDVSNGDPDDVTLEGMQSNRLASPLILRPIKLPTQHAVGLAIILDTQRIPPTGVVLKGNFPNGVNEKVVQVNLNATEARTIQPLNNQTDVLKAFLDTLR